MGKPTLVDRARFRLNKGKLESERAKAVADFGRARKTHRKFRAYASGTLQSSELVLAKLIRRRAKSTKSTFEKKRLDKLAKELESKKTRKEIEAMEIDRSLTNERKKKFSDKLLANRVAKGPVSKNELRGRKLVRGVYKGENVAFISSRGKLHQGNFQRVAINPANKKISIVLRIGKRIQYLEVANISKRISLNAFNKMTNLNITQYNPK